MVIGAGMHTFITADEVIGDFAGQLRWYLLFVFYCQIVYAPGSIEETLRLQCAHRAGREAVITV